jgi:hypothetical protein
LITSNTNGEILKWNGSKWINNTLAEAGIASIAELAGYFPRTTQTVDARSLDENTYYPVVIKMGVAITYRIKVYRNLTSVDGVPSWATHTGGFSLDTEWTSIGSGWGTIPVRRFIERHSYSWTASSPVGSIGQMTNSSYEYIYVRGGSRYHFIVEGSSSVEIVLKTETFTTSNQSVSPATSIIKPVITTDASINQVQNNLNTHTSNVSNPHNVTFALLQNKPNTIAGYGITDGITGTGNANYLPKFTGASSIGNSVIYESDGKIGIGTTTPENSEKWEQVLDVRGTAHAKSIVTTTNVHTGVWSHNSGFYGAPAGGIIGTKSNHPLSLITNGAFKVIISNIGNVGIGTTTPSQKLHVIGNAIVSGTVTAPTFIGALSGNASSATTASKIIATVTGTNSTELVRGNMADNDQFRILVGGTATNAGYAEIATADDGTEPIYVRQYTGVFTNLVRTATLLDSSGNTTFPGSVTATSFLGNASTATALTSNAGSNTNPIYFNGGKPVASSYSFGNANGNIPISNGTLNSNLNADLLDGLNGDNFLKTGFTINGDIDAYYPEGTQTFDSIPAGNPPIQNPNIRTLNLGNSFARRTQLAFPYNLNLAFLRYRIGTSWSNWREFAFTDSNVASATKLQTARTIAGVSFDGTADIAIPFANLSSKPTTLAGYGITDAANINHTHNYLNVPDTRSVVSVPQNLIRRAFQVEFKYNSSVGNPPISSNSSYSHILSIVGWNSTEGSGGWPSQVSFGDGIAIRQAINATTWGVWRTLWHSGNFTNLNQLTTRNFSDLQNKPTTLSGYGITDAPTKTGTGASGT